MVVAACLFLLGMWRLAADAHPDGRVSSPPPTTTTLINSSVIVPETTTTIAPTTTVVRHLGPLSRHQHAPVATHSAPTTTELPKTPLEIAQSQFGKTGPYADGGFWCAKFVSWTAEQATVPGFISRDGPSALYADAVADGRLTQEPVIGGMIFIDLFGPDGVGHGQVTHVGLVEYVDGSTVGIVQGNGEPDPTVITRTTYELADGYIVGFAPFEAAS